MQPGTPISFDSNSLQTSWIATSDIKHESMAAKIAIPYILAHANGTVIPYSEWSNKLITIQGTITGNGISDTDLKLDTFRSYFNGNGKNLDIGYGGGTRRYVCTALDVQVERPNGLAYANFTVTLMALTGFGRSTTQLNLITASAITASPRSDSITVGGSAPYQLVVATITLGSFTGSGSQSMTWGNNNTGQALTITRSTWAAGDIIQFDCVNRQVLVNGIVNDYQGAFPELPPGPQILGVSDTFTARSYNYSVDYYPRFV